MCPTYNAFNYIIFEGQVNIKPALTYYKIMTFGAILLIIKT